MEVVKGIGRRSAEVTDARKYNDLYRLNYATALKESTVDIASIDAGWGRATSYRRRMWAFYLSITHCATLSRELWDYFRCRTLGNNCSALIETHYIQVQIYWALLAPTATAVSYITHTYFWFDWNILDIRYWCSRYFLWGAFLDAILPQIITLFVLHYNY